MNDRIKRLRRQTFEAQPSLSIERALIETRFYRENYGKYPIPILRALNFLEICKQKTIYIGEDELIVGERVLQLEERGAAHDAARHDAARDADILEILLLVVEVVGDFARGCRHFVTGGGVGFDAQVAQRRERLPAKLFLFAEFDCHIVCF